VAVFAPFASIITTFFDCKAMTLCNHAFLIVAFTFIHLAGSLRPKACVLSTVLSTVGGFPFWEEVKFVIFTVDNQVALLTL